VTIGWPTRLIALFIADPSPAFRTGIEAISAVVSGATMQAETDPEDDERKQHIHERVHRWQERGRAGEVGIPRGGVAREYVPATGAPPPSPAARR
jgi:hypothetical protein